MDAVTDTTPIFLLHYYSSSWGAYESQPDGDARGKVGLKKMTQIHPLENDATKFQDIRLKPKNIYFKVASEDQSQDHQRC